MDNYQGWLNVYKPRGISSFGVIKKIKKKFNLTKLGHCGTLDPLAEGILPIAIGKATKLIPFINDDTKEYEFEMASGSLSIEINLQLEFFKISEVYPPIPNVAST